MTRDELARAMYNDSRAGYTLAALTVRYEQYYAGKGERPTRGWASRLVLRGRDLEDRGKAKVVPFPSPAYANQGDTGAAPGAAPYSADEALAARMRALLEDDGELEEMIEIAERLNDMKERRDPKVSHVAYEFQTDGPVAVMFVSCAHLGGRYTNHAAFKRLLDRALEIPGLFVAPLGDDIEGFYPGFIDKTSVNEQPLNVDQQVGMLQKLLARLSKARRALFGMASQHGGDWLQRRYGYNPIKELYHTYGLPWFDGQGYIKLKVGALTYNIAVAHEFPGSSQHNQLHAHSRAHHFQFPNADVIVQGDKHISAYQKATSFIWEYQAGNRPSPFVHYLQVGTAKTGLDPYTMHRWSQGVFEWPILLFDGERHRIKAADEIEDVADWLDGRQEHPGFTWAVSGRPTPDSEADYVPAEWRRKAKRDSRRSGSHGAVA